MHARLIFKKLIFQAQFTPNEYDVAVCDMPKESTVYAIYIIGSAMSVVIVCYMEYASRSYRNYVKLREKSF